MQRWLQEGAWKQHSGQSRELQQAQPAPQQGPPLAMPDAAQQKPALIAATARIVDNWNDAYTGIGDGKLQRVGDIGQFYETGYVRPTLLQALKDAEIDDAEMVARRCMETAQRAEQNGALRGTRLTAQDAAAVTLYTFSFSDSEVDQQRNPFRLINVALMERNSEKLRKLRGLIFLLLFGLRGLPQVTLPVLYRGIRQRVDLTKYQPGNTITWHSFSSTTTNLGITQRFLTDMTTGKCEGTLFQIRGKVWGYNVQPLSFFPHEEEILLEPEIDLKVTSVLALQDVSPIVVDLEMVPCQLLLENPIPPPRP